ncbi:hypothetical protein BDN70DRAFT_479802 [Pholiota conissans]|uniref:Uncharacterized protein n=1 Tax=Pholiota conissans TaxID=109636 RepID=A0A9P5YPP8_9AGAR|nr:hypothetical protein BDN70DRAFT_479802 [Pholiota conissans]
MKKVQLPTMSCSDDEEWNAESVMWKRIPLALFTTTSDSLCDVPPSRHGAFQHRSTTWIRIVSRTSLDFSFGCDERHQDRPSTSYAGPSTFCACHPSMHPYAVNRRLTLRVNRGVGVTSLRAPFTPRMTFRSRTDLPRLSFSRRVRRIIPQTSNISTSIHRLHP